MDETAHVTCFGGKKTTIWRYHQKKWPSNAKISRYYDPKIGYKHILTITKANPSKNAGNYICMSDDDKDDVIYLAGVKVTVEGKC